jgi:hypothetical protein
MKKLLLITLMAAAVGLWSCSSGSKRFAGFEVGKSYDVNFSFPDLAEEEFGDREKADQAKDWLLYTLMTNSGLKTNDIAHSSFDLAPVRYGFNQAIGNFEYGPTRCRYIGEGEVVALVPESDEKELADNLAHIFDETRKNQGEKPKKAYVFTYDLNVEGRSARLVRLENMDVADYFTEEKGYYETKANSVDELKSFLEKIDDVTYAEKASDGLVFGGRKLQNDKYGKITIEDIAAIWQSEKEIQTNETLLNTRRSELESKREAGRKPIIQKYQDQLDNLQFEDGTNFRDLTDFQKEEVTKFVGKFLTETLTDRSFEENLRLSKMFSDHRADENLHNLTRNFRDELNEFRKSIRKEESDFVKDANDSRFAHASGFSLDPAINIEASIAFVNEHPYTFAAALSPQYTVEQLLQQLQDHEDGMMRYAVNSLKSRVADSICTYQKARYDGSLHGTAVGMTLFYTDLLAKIWACNMYNSKPEAFVPDFVDNEQTYVGQSKVFEKESDTLDAVRLWFGPNKNGFQVSGSGSAINFARNATQIFALGHDDNTPPDSITGKIEEKEMQASAQFETPLAWWNNRFEEVARYEKQYERLNEIMKWSTIISWLNAGYSSSDLSYLNTYHVSHELWFPDWAKNNSELKFTNWDQVNFYTKGFANSKTEAMPILYSPRLLVSGGVSLADRSLIKEAPELLTVEKQMFRRANLTEDLAEPNTFKTFRDTKIGFVEELEGKRVDINLQAKEGYKLRNNFGEVENRSFKWTLAEDANGSYSYNSVLGDVPIGKLTATKTGKNSFAVAFESQSIDKGMSVARQCSDFSGDMTTFFKNHPEVVRYVQTESGEWCVQLKNSDEWMVLKIHPDDYAGSIDLPAGYTARTSGTTFDSKIVEMKWVSETEAAKLTGPMQPIKTQTDLFTGSAGKFYDDLVEKVGKDGVEKEMVRLRQEGITEAEKLATDGEYVKSAMYTEKMIKYLGETDALVAMKVKYDLKAGLFMLENKNLVMAKRFVNEAMSMRPHNVDFLNEITEMLRVSPIKGEPRRTFTNLVDCYLTDKQIFAEASWQGYGACSKKVSIDAITQNGKPKILYSDNGAFSNIDPSTPFETIMAQIRSVPGAEAYDISAVAVNRNTRVYADVEPEMLLPGITFNRLRLRVAPGAINHCNDADKNNERKCDDRYTIKGPVYYITAPKPVATEVN